MFLGKVLERASWLQKKRGQGQCKVSSACFAMYQLSETLEDKSDFYW